MGKSYRCWSSPISEEKKGLQGWGKNGIKGGEVQPVQSFKRQNGEKVDKPVKGRGLKRETISLPLRNPIGRCSGLPSEDRKKRGVEKGQGREENEVYLPAPDAEVGMGGLPLKQAAQQKQQKRRRRASGAGKKQSRSSPSGKVKKKLGAGGKIRCRTKGGTGGDTN